MKANHGSGYVKVVHDKAETSFEEFARAKRALAGRRTSTVLRASGTTSIIKPRIFFEAMLTDESGNIPADFKIHCFNQVAGKQKAFILHISDRFTPHPRGDFYDEDWNQLDIRIGHYPNSAVPSPRPDNLDEILRNAKQLSANFDYVRVDLYAPDDRIFFGELTFTPGAGVYRLTPDQIDYDWGRMLQAHSPSTGVAASPMNVPR